MIQGGHGRKIGEVVRGVDAGGSERWAIQEAQWIGSRPGDPGTAITAGPVLSCDIVLSNCGKRSRKRSSAVHVAGSSHLLLPKDKNLIKKALLCELAMAEVDAPKRQHQAWRR